jgi:hypothetical protein
MSKITFRKNINWIKKDDEFQSNSKKGYFIHNKPKGNEKILDLFDQLKKEYSKVENDLNIAKLQKEDFERKCKF